MSNPWDMAGIGEHGGKDEMPKYDGSLKPPDWGCG